MSYEILVQKWEGIRSEMPQDSWKKLSVLLRTKDEMQVQSSFALLISHGESALCAMLYEKEGQLYFQNKPRHPVLWLTCILEEVRREQSAWHDLYVRGYFHRLERYWYGNVPWNALSDTQQKKVVEKSLRSAEIPAGSFMMGPTPGFDTQKVRHKVTLTKAMRMGIYPCTQGLYESVMGSNPSFFTGSMRPVEKVSWCDAVLFCNKLSEREGLVPCYVLPEPFLNDDNWSKKVKWNKSANGYRLPTEAEWEYCARGGEKHLYSGSDNRDKVAWYDGNSRGKTHPVGEKKANRFGLYDMSGNVWEWVWDWKGSYSKGLVIDPHGPSSGTTRVSRGGCWRGGTWGTRVSGRYEYLPSYRNSNLGFRLVRTIK